MSTLKTTIQLDSNTLFPNPLAIKSTNTLTINDESSSFITNDIQPNGNEVLLETEEQSGDSGILYLYCQSAASNSAHGIELSLTHFATIGDDDTMTIAKLLPGNTVLLPIYAAGANGLRVNIKNNDPINVGTLTYFYGSRD
jgi:hypothetical protein